MARSNSENYTLTGLEAIISAFEMIGISKGGEDLAGEDFDTAKVTLNIMLKAMQQKLNIWKRKTTTINLIEDQVTYSFGQKSRGVTSSTKVNSILDTHNNFNTDKVQIGDRVLNTTAGTQAFVIAIASTTELTLDADIFLVTGESYEVTDADVSVSRPMKILECNRRGTAGDEVTMNVLTRNEYENLPNKNISGTPISYHYDPTINNGTFYLWLSPDAAAVTQWTIELVYQAAIEDVDVATDELDLPSENLEALITNLAYRLSWRFGGLSASERRDLKMDAKEYLYDAEGYEQYNGGGDVYMAPEIRNY